MVIAALAAVHGLADGANWTQIDAGLPRTAAGVRQVVVDPLSAATVYAVGFNTQAGEKPWQESSLFRSGDGGGTWTVLPSITGILALAIDPADSSTLYAVAQGLVMKSSYAVAQGLVMKSTDAGQSWSSTGAGPASVLGLAIDPQNPAVVYAMASNAIYKSTDGGANWAAKTTGLPSQMYGSHLVFDPQNTSILYAGVNGVYQSLDAGESWRMVSPPPGPGGGFCQWECALAADPSHASTIYAVLFTPTSPAPNGNVFRLYKTIDAGATWTPSDAGIPGQVGSLVVDADSSVYAAWSGDGTAGVVKSTDGGAIWGPLHTGLPSNVPFINSLALASGNPSTLFAGYFDEDGGRGGVFKTANGGANWNDSSSGLTFLSVNALAVDSTNPQTVYVAVGDGISKSTDSGQNWTVSHFPSPLIPGKDPGGGGRAYVPSVLIDPNNPNVVYASSLPTNGCYFMDPFLRKSTDGGATWNDLGVTYCASGPQIFLALDPNNSSTLFAAPQNGVECGAYVYETTEAGADWTQNVIWGEYITALAIAAGNPPVLYAAYNSIGSPSNGGLFKSTDANTWTATGLMDLVTALAVDPADGNTIYAGTAKGLFKTVDAGVTWTLFHALPEGSSITALAIHPKSGILYIGTSQSGLFRSSSGAAWISLNDGLPNLIIQALAVGSDESGTIYASTAGGVFTMKDSPRQVFRRR